MALRNAFEELATAANQDLKAKYSIADTDTSGTTKYYGFTDKDANWFIMRENTTTGEYRYVKGSAAVSPNDYPTKWTNRVTQTYRYFYEEF